MKKSIGYFVIGVLSFIGGSVAGWFARKKTAEVTFLEVTPEEQAEAMAEDGYTPEIMRPLDIQEAIDRTFGISGREVPANDNGADTDGDHGLQQIDTQKERYFQQWKADEIARKYDTRTQEAPEQVVTTDEDEDEMEAGLDKELLNEVERWQRGGTGATIEEGTMTDWDRWMGIPDGDYDPVEVWWFDQDDVLTDDHEQPLVNPGKFMGFDVKRKFEEISEETTGDPDIRVIYNHKQHAIFQIIRKHASYGSKSTMEEFGGDREDDRNWIRSRYT